MYFIYNLVFIFLTILFLPVILAALAVVPKFRAGFFQKAGFYEKSFGDEKSIWVHAVSVGEVNAVENFVKRLRKEFPNEKIVLSTVTKTGNAVANQKFQSTVDKIVYFPFDFSFAINSAIKSVNPKLVIIAETEIWPNFAYRLKKKNIPCMIINGRISPNSYKGYKKFSWFFKKVLNNYSRILMQTLDDMARIIDIGASPDITNVMGNLKFDIEDTKLSFKEIESLKNQLEVRENKVIIAGSTHKGEDEIIIRGFKKLKQEFSDLKMILAPRHPERLASVENLLKDYEVNCSLRSKGGNFSVSDVILLDTMGELSKLYSISAIAFIGGSFSSTGGHNPLEAAIYGVPTVSGNIVFNFKDIYRFLIDKGASFLVENKEQLLDVLIKLLREEEFYQKASAASIAVFEDNKGALANALNEVKEILT
ncbi:MAG: 3-deoxy-D-manno-octulosonic acid transferase [Candidatus Gastranaerophilales bacterium]|nr:3-deoxy-D-manno-octulosonic acid transferase [Candidatus Gastranaerophilales bacterium]